MTQSQAVIESLGGIAPLGKNTRSCSESRLSYVRIYFKNCISVKMSPVN